MKLRAVLPLLFLLAVSAFSQTTYTTTQDGCGAKNLGYCILNVDSAGHPYQLTLDHRSTAQGPIDRLTISEPFPGPQLLSVHGTYTITPCTAPAKTCYGTASFVSDDGLTVGDFQTYEYYVGSCSGRGCYGTVVGWHYRVQAGSTVKTP